MDMKQKMVRLRETIPKHFIRKNVALFFLNIRLCWLIEIFILFNNAAGMRHVKAVIALFLIFIQLFRFLL